MSASTHMQSHGDKKKKDFSPKITSYLFIKAFCPDIQDFFFLFPQKTYHHHWFHFEIRRHAQNHSKPSKSTKHYPYFKVHNLFSEFYGNISL